MTARALSLAADIIKAWEGCRTLAYPDTKIKKNGRIHSISSAKMVEYFPIIKGIFAMSKRKTKLCEVCHALIESEHIKHCTMACALKSKILISQETGCWNWTGALTSTGYGHLNFGKKNHWKAHRASWVEFRGAIPPGILVCHKCDNPLCINPDHLFLGTHKDNTSDMISKGRHSSPPTHYGDEHPLRKDPTRVRRGATNGNSRYSDEQARAAAASTSGPVQTCRDIGISRHFYYRIRNGKHHRDLLGRQP